MKVTRQKGRYMQSTVPKKDGDWYIYPQFLAHENHKIAHKNAQKSFINFKPRIGNVAITGTNFAPHPHPQIWLYV